MARPKKQTVDYFPHFVNSGKTMFILESNFGNDGYAFWFKLLELLGITQGHSYDCNNTADWEFLLAKTHVTGVIANNILKKLADLNAIDKELWENRIVWSDNFVQNLLPLYSNRKTNLPQKPVIGGRNDGKDEFLPLETPVTGITTAENPQSKVKESKVKESKVNNNNNNVVVDTKKSYIDFFNNNFHMITMFELETLNSFKNDGMEDEVIKLAMEKAVENNVRTINYVKAILQKWLEGNIKTVAAVNAADKEFKRNKVNPSGKSKGEFTNCQQRDYSKEEMKELENKLLGWDKND